MANRISFISRLPSAIQAQRDYVQGIEVISTQLADRTKPDYVIENTRTVCRKYLKQQCEEVNRSLVSEVDSALMELAKKSGFLHRFKVKSLIKKWDALDPYPESIGTQEDLQKLVLKIAQEIVILNKKYEERNANQ
jgi:hypothetical protein